MKKLVAILAVIGLIGSTQANLVGYFPFDTDSGTTISDQATETGDNSGALAAGETFSTDAKFGGQSLRLSSAVTGGASGSDVGWSTGNSSYSLSLWVKAIDPLSGGPVLFAHGSTVNTQANGFWLQNNTTIRHYHWSGPDLIANFPGDTMSTGIWHHIVAVHDHEAGDREAVYYDGVKLLEMGGFETVNVTLNQWVMGYNLSGGLEFHGLLDDVAVFDNAITDNDVAVLWNDGTGNPAIALEKTARNLSPQDGEINVLLDTMLIWQAPQAYTPVAYDVWFGTDANELSPNYDMTKILDYQNVMFVDPGILDYDTTYVWRVDSYEPDTVPIMHQGDLWTFMALPSDPVITEDPEDQLVNSNEAAVFNVTAYDPTGSGLNYQWYKYIDGVNDIAMGTDDPVLVVPGPLGAADEGNYYCSVSNVSAEASVSSQAKLVIRKLIGHWLFDGNVNDASGAGNEGILTGQPTYIAGVNGVGQAMEFNGFNQAVSLPSAVFDAMTDKEVAVSFWQYGADSQPLDGSVFGAFDGCDNRIWNSHLPFGNSMVYWKACDVATTYICDRIAKVATVENYKGQWNYWVFTKNVTNNVMKIYLNGMLWHEGNGTQPIGVPIGFTIGSAGDSYYYNGAIDDFRIYNYSPSAEEVAQFYFDVTGNSVCLSVYDLTNDCVVDLLDFSLLASEWLVDRTFPAGTN